MPKCDAYFTCSQRDFEGETYEQGHCSASKWSVECRCNGDTDNCTFYPEKRKQTMNTAEMWLKAQEDGKTYVCNDIAYSKEIGLVDKRTMSRPWSIGVWKVEFGTNDKKKRELDNLMSLKWEPLSTMTRAEAESKLGVKIID